MFPSKTYKALGEWKPVVNPTVMTSAEGHAHVFTDGRYVCKICKKSRVMIEEERSNKPFNTALKKAIEDAVKRLS